MPCIPTGCPSLYEPTFLPPLPIEGIPGFYLDALAELNDVTNKAVAVAKEGKGEGAKKQSKANGKAMISMKQKLLRTTKQYEGDMAKRASAPKKASSGFDDDDSDGDDSDGDAPAVTKQVS